MVKLRRGSDPSHARDLSPESRPSLVLSIPWMVCGLSHGCSSLAGDDATNSRTPSPAQPYHILWNALWAPYLVKMVPE
jgi:hypothetical protein